MATQSPSEQYQNEINSLKSKIDKLQDGVRFKDIRDSLEDLQTSINNMEQQLREIRQDGYVFEKNLEPQVKDINDQLEEILPRVHDQIDKQSSTLSTSLRSIESQFSRISSLSPSIGKSNQNLERLKTSVSTLEGNVSSAKNTITGMYDSFRSKVNEIIGHLTEIEWMLNQIGEASFSLMPTESAIMAVKAVWSKSKKEAWATLKSILLEKDDFIRGIIGGDKQLDILLTKLNNLLYTNLAAT